MTPANRAEWIRVIDERPPDGTEVETKVDDAGGVRNETKLIWSRNLWWLPDMSMYVYYTPTHWRLSSPMPTSDRAERREHE